MTYSSSLRSWTSIGIQEWSDIRSHRVIGVPTLSLPAGQLPRGSQSYANVTTIARYSPPAPWLPKVGTLPSLVEAGLNPGVRKERRGLAGSRPAPLAPCPTTSRQRACSSPNLTSVDLVQSQPNLRSKFSLPVQVLVVIRQ